MALKFELLGKDPESAARRGRLTLPHGVVETPNGAHFTTCTPDYERDEKFQKTYAAAAGGSDEDWAAFKQRFLSGDEAAYQSAVADLAAEHEGAK